MKKNKTVPTGVLSPQSIQNAVPMHKNEIRIVFGEKKRCYSLVQSSSTHTHKIRAERSQEGHIQNVSLHQSVRNSISKCPTKHKISKVIRCFRHIKEKLAQSTHAETQVFVAHMAPSVSKLISPAPTMSIEHSHSSQTPVVLGFYRRRFHVDDGSSFKLFGHQL